MRRLTLLWVLYWTLFCTACSRHQAAPQVLEEPPTLAQTVAMGNLEHAKQLGKGFYAIEDGAWRWTQGKFSLMLRPPLQAEQQGALLVVKATIPPAVIEKLKDVTVTAVVNNVRLSSTNFNKPGAIVLKVDVPPKALQGDAATVEFVLDKVLPPRQDDRRELGLIVTSIGFERKT